MAGDQVPIAEQSMTDRVAAQFGLSEPERQDQPAEQEATAPQPEEVETAEAEAAPEEPEAEFAEVEYDGERFKVPKKLEKAILQEKDYTQKTQKIAEERRQWEVLQEQNKLRNIEAAFERELFPEIQKLQAYEAVLKQPVDWNSMPMEEMVRTRAQRDQWRDEANALKESLSSKRQEFGAKLDAALKDLKSKAVDTVAKSLPGWSEKSLNSLREYGKTEGYSEAELQGIDADPRHIRTLHKAMEYDRLMASKATAVKEANKAPPMVKPGATRPMPQAVKNELALKKAIKAAPTSAEKAKNIQKILEGRF